MLWELARNALINRKVKLRIYFAGMSRLAGFVPFWKVPASSPDLYGRQQAGDRADRASGTGRGQ